MDKPNIFWLVSVTLPGAARALGLTGAIGGGWVEGQLGAVKGRAHITVCTVNGAAKRPLYAEADGVTYAVLPRGSSEEFSALLQRVKPDLVHLWGSEYPPAPALLALCRPEQVLLSVQGLMGPCAEHLLDGVPPQYCGSCAVQRMIDRVVPGGLLDKQQGFFDAQAEREKALLSQLRHVSGRTTWDKVELARLAPNARYYHCGETLRPAFYTAPDEEADLQNDKNLPDEDGPVLLLSQGNLPLKGLHRLIEALPAVRAVYPNAQLRVAGWPPLDKGPLLRGVIRWMFPYQRYCAELAAQLGVADIIRYTGPLNAAAMRRQYLAADVFLLCSSIENSPNSLGEAMLLGRPCVASRVGGVPSLLEDGREGLLYPADDPAALADAILALLGDPARAAALGRAARARALKNHDPAQNAKDLLAIYRRMLDGLAGGPDTGPDAPGAAGSQRPGDEEGAANSASSGPGPAGDISGQAGTGQAPCGKSNTPGPAGRPDTARPPAGGVRVSVIVPAYRAEDTLRGCAGSILQNAPENLELILVDDGSPDGTGRLCDELAAKDRRVTALHRPNGGAAAARNTGLEAARGEYIAFVDADDELLPGLWQAALPVLAAGRPDLYGFGVRRSDGVLECGPAGSFARPGDLGEEELGRLLVDTGVLAAPYAKFYRADLLHRHHIRFDETLKINEDILFNLHVLAVCGPLRFGPGAFYQYQSEGAGSLSRRLRDDLLTAEAYTRPAFEETLAALGLPGDAAGRLILRRRLHCAKAQFGLLAGQKGRLPLGRRRQLLAEILAVPGAREALLADYRADERRLLALPYRVCLRLGLPGPLAVYCAAKERFL